MSVKLADTLQAMADFPVAMASGINIVKEDDTEKDLQQMYEDGELGGESMPMPLSANMLLVSENDETSGDLIWSQIDKSEVGSVPLICTEEEWEELDPKPVEGTEVIITDDEDGASSGGISVEELWVNANPTATFNAQTVTISNLSDYKLILFKTRHHTTRELIETKTIVNIPQTTCINTNFFGGNVRDIEIKSDSIVFGSGVFYPNYSAGTGNTDNNFCYPIKIYGIK